MKDVVEVNQVDIDRYTVLRFIEGSTVEHSALMMGISTERAELYEKHLLRKVRGSKTYDEH